VSPLTLSTQLPHYHASHAGRRDTQALQDLNCDPAGHTHQREQQMLGSYPVVAKLVGPAQPAPLFVRSDFWAQGINVGLEFRY